MKNSSELFIQSQKVIPGGVNSPVRAFKAVGKTPIFIDRADGAKIYDVEGNSYLDYVMSWGPMILGHNHEIIRNAVIEATHKGLSFGASTEPELVMAKMITEFTGIDMVRMVSSGTEAVMSAIRLARGYTKKDKLIKFEGCYHGHSDSMLVKAGSGLLTNSTPDSSGVPKELAAHTLVAQYNDLESVKTLLEKNKEQVAAIIIEPVCANMGVVCPKENFLKELRVLCDEHNVLLIFDEVITGFRLGLGGAQSYFGVKADIVTYGKIVGGGLPVGAYGGKREIMECISPCGDVYQAGTLSGNPIAMAAGITQLNILKNNPEIYERIDDLCDLLAQGFENIIRKLNIDGSVAHIGTLCCLFLGKERYAEFFGMMLQQGIYLAPSQFEAMFISNAHTKTDIENTLACAEKALSAIYSVENNDQSEGRLLPEGKRRFDR